MALAPNSHGRFIDRWVSMTHSPKSRCVWTKGLTDIRLPVRHKEGRVVFSQLETAKNLDANGQIVLRYDEDINGSVDQIAGVCDETGLIFGLMPHPEAGVFVQTDPQHHATSILAYADGFQIFRNIVEFCHHR